MVARSCDVDGVANSECDSACFPVSPDDSSQNVTATGASETAPKSSAKDMETALAAALSRAAEAGRFDIVAQLARELEARRLARAGSAVRLDDRERGER